MTNEPLDLLVFAPHPDDAEIGMGGTILKAIAKGKRVGVVDLTRGERGTKGDANTRAQEAMEATRLMKLSARDCLDLGDGFLQDNEESRLAIVETIRRRRSPSIFCCPPFDRHPDHQMAARLVQAAFFLARLPKVETQSPAYSPRRLMYYFIHDVREMSFGVDISDFVEGKRSALACYRSQFIDAQTPPGYIHIGNSDYLTQIEALNRALGEQIGAQYAEGFSSPTPLRLDLPLES